MRNLQKHYDELEAEYKESYEQSYDSIEEYKYERLIAVHDVIADSVAGIDKIDKVMFAKS